MRRLGLLILVCTLLSAASTWALELTCKGKGEFDAYTIKLSFIETRQPDVWGKATVKEEQDIFLEDGNGVMDDSKVVQIRGTLRDTGEPVFILLRLDSDLTTGEAVISTGRSGNERAFGTYTCKISRLISRL